MSANQFNEQPGEPTGSALSTARVIDEAERVAEIADALLHIDAARHQIDGRHETCRACGARPHVVTVYEDSHVYHDMATDHADDCPINDLARAADRLYRLM